MKRCQSICHGHTDVFECERKRGHKGKHRVRWWEGRGAHVVRLIARWP